MGTQVVPACGLEKLLAGWPSPWRYAPHGSSALYQLPEAVVSRMEYGSLRSMPIGKPELMAPMPPMPPGCPIWIGIRTNISAVGHKQSVIRKHFELACFY
uniref:Uncharacterized protein n=1 Tax=Cryptomonas curvata TaxID=233186 RepID=A0A7S0MRL4_9CRYP